MDGRELRLTLSSAVAFVKAVEQNRSTSPITLDHVLSDHVTSIRDVKLPQLDRLQKSLEEVIEAIEKAGTDTAQLERIGVYEASASVRTDDGVTEV